MDDFAEILRQSTAAHGHFCPGQALGVRMALAGCRLAGIEDPKGSRDLLVFVEIDRCLADAIQSVTGCRLGKRTLKFLDYGKAAATFANVKTGLSWRLAARSEARELAWRYAPNSLSKADAQRDAYQIMPEEELFTIRQVELSLPPEDLPGRPLNRVICAACAEEVSDGREMKRRGKSLCRPCAEAACWQPLEAGLIQRKPVPLIGVAGNSDSGKTRVATALVEQLAVRGYRVAAIKHCPHGHQPGKPGSDSVRLLEAGGELVIASSPGMTTRTARAGGDASLTSIVETLPAGIDLVVAEGFKASPCPKILVGTAPVPTPRNVIASVNGDSASGDLPEFDIECLGQLAAWVESKFLL